MEETAIVSSCLAMEAFSIRLWLLIAMIRTRGGSQAGGLVRRPVLKTFLALPRGLENDFTNGPSTKRLLEFLGSSLCSVPMRWAIWGVTLSLYGLHGLSPAFLPGMGAVLRNSMSHWLRNQWMLSSACVRQFAKNNNMANNNNHHPLLPPMCLPLW